MASCYDEDGNGEKVKPLDELLEENRMEFESGEEKECDRDLDEMIWKLGDYENEAPLHEAAEFAEALPLEEELVEKTLHGGRNGRAEFRETEYGEKNAAVGEKLGEAASLGLGKERKERKEKSSAARPPGKKKSRPRGIAA